MVKYALKIFGKNLQLMLDISNYIENKIGLDKTDKDLYNILACIRLHCLK